MDWKTIYGWPLHVHRELKDIVTGLGGGNVSGIKVAMNLVITFHLNGGMIWTLVYVLANWS
jgi:hypothetical protein